MGFQKHQAGVEAPADSTSDTCFLALSISVLLRFAGSVVLPIALVVLEFYVSRALG